MTPHEWNAREYDHTNAGIIALGGEVLERLPLNGDETVLDAGCGTGAVTQLILQRVPAGRVIGVDASAQMVEHARSRFSAAQNVEILQADLSELDLGDARVDAVLSTATLHWIHDHATLWRNLRAAMRDGAPLAAQYGGAGNIASVLEVATPLQEQAPYAEYLSGFAPHNFLGPEETEALMRAAGFSDVRAWLEERPVHPEDLGKHLREVILGAHAERMPPELFEKFAKEIDTTLGNRNSVDYVRLNIQATA